MCADWCCSNGIVIYINSKTSIDLVWSYCLLLPTKFPTQTGLGYSYTRCEICTYHTTYEIRDSKIIGICLYYGIRGASWSCSSALEQTYSMVGLAWAGSGWLVFATGWSRNFIRVHEQVIATEVKESSWSPFHVFLSIAVLICLVIWRDMKHTIHRISTWANSVLSWFRTDWLMELVGKGI